MHRACNGGCVLASGEVQGTKLPSRGTRLKGEDSRVAELKGTRPTNDSSFFQAIWPSCFRPVFLPRDVKFVAVNRKGG